MIKRAASSLRSPAGIRRRDDAFLETEIRSSITSRPVWIGVRTIAMAGASLIALTMTEISNRSTVALILAVAALLQPLVLLVRANWQVPVLQATTDIIVSTVVVIAAPDLWPAALVWIGATVAWQGITSPSMMMVPFTALAVTSSLVAGLAGDVRYWWTAVIIIFAMAVAFSTFGFRLRREFREHEQDLMLTLARAGAIVHHTDLVESRVSRVTGDVEVLTGWSASEWTEADHRLIIHPDDLDDYWIDADQVEDGAIIDRSYRVLRRDGSVMWLRDVSRVSVDRRGHQTLSGFSLDITELEAANSEIAASARTDPLTGLPNRLALTECLRDLNNTDSSFALMLIDLDRFKEVNDILGHSAGDQMLQMVSERLTRALRPEEFLSRLGGDEFAIVLDDVIDSGRVIECIDRLTFECSQPMSVHGVRVAISMSIGVAFSTDQAGDESLLRQADIAMYTAKRAGQTYWIFDESLEETSTARLSLTALLPDALANGEFELHFQPKVDLRSRRVVGAEGLARWNHPERGLLGPDAFLDVATMSESATVFARSMIEQGVAMAKQLAEAGRPMPIAVNISLRVVQEDDFSTWLFSTLGRHGVSPKLLILELTERDVQDPSPQARATLDELTAAGVELSIDDFGTGHSSMRRLRQLEVDELKIDRSFVAGIIDNSVDREIVGSIIELAARLGSRVVAEGVEDEEVVARLIGLDCSIAQGFLFAKALPPTEFHQLVLDEQWELHAAGG